MAIQINDLTSDAIEANLLVQTGASSPTFLTQLTLCLYKST